MEDVIDTEVIDDDSVEEVHVAITITGKAISPDPEYVAEAIARIEEAASAGFEDIEVVSESTDALGDDDFSPRTIVMSKVFENEMRRQEAIDDANFVPLTEAEQEALAEENRKRDSEYARREFERRMSTASAAFDVAEKWGAKTELSPLERCHGVAWEMQKNSVSDTQKDLSTKYNFPLPTPEKDYAEVYEEKKQDDILKGIMRSAASLFT
jgi:hypothetical protein